jgi:hypothetical protein
MAARWLGFIRKACINAGVGRVSALVEQALLAHLPRCRRPCDGAQGAEFPVSCRLHGGDYIRRRPEAD